MASQALCQIRFYPALSQKERKNHRLYVRAMAFSLRRQKNSTGDHEPTPLFGRISGHLQNKIDSQSKKEKYCKKNLYLLQ